MRELMVGNAGIEPETADRLLQWLVRHRVKSKDLRDLLTERPWLTSPG